MWDFRMTVTARLSSQLSSPCQARLCTSKLSLQFISRLSGHSSPPLKLWKDASPWLVAHSSLRSHLLYVDKLHLIIARILKILRSPRIDSKDPILPGCVAWRGGPVWQPYSYSVPSPHRLFKNSSTVYQLRYLSDVVMEQITKKTPNPKCGGDRVVWRAFTGVIYCVFD